MMVAPFLFTSTMTAWLTGAVPTDARTTWMMARPGYQRSAPVIGAERAPVREKVISWEASGRCRGRGRRGRP
jgi:hypothetical protein